MLFDSRFLFCFSSEAATTRLDTTTVTASDGTYSESVTFNWAVSSPINITDQGDQFNLDSDTVSLAIGATDNASGTMSFAASGLPSGLSINASTGLITGTIGSSADTASPYTATITVTDGTNIDIDTFAWDVNPASVVLVANPGSQSNAAGDIVVLQIQAMDTTGNTLSYIATGLPDGLYLNPNTGLIFGTVAGEAVSGSPYAVTVEATNTANYSATQTFSWTVNAASTVTLTNPGDQTNNEGGSVSVTLTAHDSGAGTLSYVAFGLPPGLKINTGTGTITGTVALDDAAYGPYTVTVMANDGTYSAEQTLNWNVNSPVTLTLPADQTNNEGDSVSVTLSATDSTSATLSYSAQGLPPGLTINPSTGVITGTIAVGDAAAGSYSVTVIANDDTYSTTQTFNWNVNSPITLNVPDDETNNDGDAVSVTLSASDSATGTLTYSAQGLPPGLAIDPSTGVISGTVIVGDSVIGTFEPTIIVSDGTYSNSTNFEWDVNSVLSITDPGDQANTVGDSVSFTVVATDTNSETLTYAASGLPNGLSINTSTGVISGTITSGATAIGTFTTTITVGDSTVTTTDTFNWTITGSGVVTLTTPGSQMTAEGDSSVSLSLSASDSDSATLKYFAEGLPFGLKINPSTGAITGTVANNDAAYGSYTVTVIATDGTNSAEETFTWMVNDPVSIDTVADLTYTESDSMTLALSGSGTGADTLTYGAIGLPPGLQINTSTGAITGTVALGDSVNGIYSVTVLATDGTYSTAQTFNFTVNGLITFTLPSTETNVEGDTVSLSFSATDSSSGTLTYTAVGLPAGLTINPSTGSVTGTVAPGAAANGPDTVIITASDGTYSASETITWDLSSPITFTNPGVEVYSVDSTVDLQIQASDIYGGTLRYVAVGLPSGLSINPATGLISNTSGDSTIVAGIYDITVTVTDADESNVETVSCTIEDPKAMPTTTYTSTKVAADETTVNIQLAYVLRLRLAAIAKKIIDQKNAITKEMNEIATKALTLVTAKNFFTALQEAYSLFEKVKKLNDLFAKETPSLLQEAATLYAILYEISTNTAIQISLVPEQEQQGNQLWYFPANNQKLANPLDIDGTSGETIELPWLNKQIGYSITVHPTKTHWVPAKNKLDGYGFTQVSLSLQVTAPGLGKTFQFGVPIYFFIPAYPTTVPLAMAIAFDPAKEEISFMYRSTLDRSDIFTEALTPAWVNAFKKLLPSVAQITRDEV